MGALTYLNGVGQPPQMNRADPEEFSFGGKVVRGSRLYGFMPYAPVANPSVLPTDIYNDVSWSPDGRYLAIVGNVTPFVIVYSFDGTTFTKLANPATLPTGGANGVAWSPDGKTLAVAHYTSPFMTLYLFNGTSLTKLSNPTTLPVTDGQSVDWAPDGRYLAITFMDWPWFYVYR